MELMIRHGDEEYTVEEFAELMKQLGRCECGRHGALQNQRLRFAGHDEDLVTPVCTACGKPIDAHGNTIEERVLWNTVLPSDLSLTPNDPAYRTPGAVTTKEDRP